MLECKISDPISFPIRDDPLVAFRLTCPVKYIEDVERSEFNRGFANSLLS